MVRALIDAMSKCALNRLLPSNPLCHMYKENGQLLWRPFVGQLMTVNVFGDRVPHLAVCLSVWQPKPDSPRLKCMYLCCDGNKYRFFLDQNTPNTEHRNEYAAGVFAQPLGAMSPPLGCSPAHISAGEELGNAISDLMADAYTIMQASQELAGSHVVEGVNPLTRRVRPAAVPVESSDSSDDEESGPLPSERPLKRRRASIRPPAEPTEPAPAVPAPVVARLLGTGDGPSVLNQSDDDA